MLTTLVSWILLAQTPAELPKTFGEVEKLKWEAYQSERPFKARSIWTRERKGHKPLVNRFESWQDKGRTRLWFWAGGSLTTQAVTTASTIWMVAYEAKTYWLTSAPEGQGKEADYVPLKADPDSFKVELANRGYPQWACDPAITLESITDAKIKDKPVRLVVATSKSRKKPGSMLTIKQWFEKDRWLLLKAELDMTGDPETEESDIIELKEATYRCLFQDPDFELPKDDIKGFNRITPPTVSG